MSGYSVLVVIRCGTKNGSVGGNMGCSWKMEHGNVEHFTARNPSGSEDVFEQLIIAWKLLTFNLVSWVPELDVQDIWSRAFGYEMIRVGTMRPG